MQKRRNLREDLCWLPTNTIGGLNVVECIWKSMSWIFYSLRAKTRTVGLMFGLKDECFTTSLNAFESPARVLSTHVMGWYHARWDGWFILNVRWCDVITYCDFISNVPIHCMNDIPLPEFSKVSCQEMWIASLVIGIKWRNCIWVL